MSGLGKQAKTLNKAQIEMISTYLRSRRNGLRNQTIFLLSVRAVRPGGYALLATFHLNGPTKCSGLPVQRYDADTLISTLNDYNQCQWDLLKAREWTHLTPAGTKQQSQYLLAKQASFDAEISPPQNT